MSNRKQNKHNQEHEKKSQEDRNDGKLRSHALGTSNISFETPSIIKRKKIENNRVHQKNHREKVAEIERSGKIWGFLTGDSLIVGHVKTELLLLPVVDFWKLMGEVDFSITDWVFLRENRKVQLDYNTLTSGAIGLVPPTLLINLLRDLKGDPIRTKHLKWDIISRKIYEGKRGKGRYYMFHWIQGGPVTFRGGQSNWKDSVTILSQPTKAQVDNLACHIVRKIKTFDKGKSDQDIMEEYDFYPGMVTTVTAYHQRAHLDLEQWGIVVHAPLCLEGMMVLVWPRNCRKKSGTYIHVPFGCFLCLPASVIHAGVYGNEGNLRFHMIIRPKTSLLQEEVLLDQDKYNKDEMTGREDWKQNFDRLRSRKESKLLMMKVVEVFTNKFNGFFDEGWLGNIE